MSNLKTEQITAANYPISKYSEYALIPERMGPEWSFMHVIPIFMWMMQGCLR